MIPPVYFPLFQIHHRLSKLIILLLLIASISSHAQTIRYVKPSPSGSGDGSSWANATSDLQVAISSLPVVGGQVWVAGGLYKPTTLTGPDSRTISFELKNGVAIYGGFAGNEASISDRVVSRPSSTTLSGNIGDEASSDDNSNTVLHGLKVDSMGVLDGLVITEGGAGLDVTNGHFLLNNCVFDNNKGVALYVLSSVGGPFNGYYSTFRVTNCVFQNNESGLGTFNGRYSGISLSLVNCVFQNNRAPADQYGYGGALYVAEGSDASIINCTFRNNYAYQGAVLASVSYYNNSSTQINMLNCIVFGNRSVEGDNNFYGGPSTFRYSLIDKAYPNLEASVIISTASPFVSETSSQLDACSYAVNSGDPTTTTATVGTTDLAGNPRLVRNRIDMGAYEYQGAVCVPPNDDIYTLQAGRWNDSATWSLGRLPTSTDRVLLKHAITIPQNYLAYILKLKLDASARLIYESGGRLSVDFLQR